MLIDLYIPWTSRFHRRIPEPPSTPEPLPPSGPNKVCTRTLHIARAIIAHAVQPFPEVSRAIGAAFCNYILGKIAIDVEGDPSSWKVVEHLS